MEKLEEWKKRIEEIKSDLLITISYAEDKVKNIEDNESKGGYSGISRNELGTFMEELNERYYAFETALNSA